MIPIVVNHRGSGLSREDEYLCHAAECMNIAISTEDPAIKIKMIGMAQTWLRLAEQARKNAKADLVYETPQRRQPET